MGAPCPAAYTVCRKGASYPKELCPCNPNLSTPQVRNSVVIQFTKLAKFCAFPLHTNSAHEAAVARAELLALAPSAVLVWTPHRAVLKPTLCFEARCWVTFLVHWGRSPSQLHGISLDLPLWTRMSPYYSKDITKPVCRCVDAQTWYCSKA